MEISTLKNQIPEILSRVPPFRYLTESQIILLQSFGQVIEYKPSSIILTQGKVGSGLYVILNGQAEVKIRRLGEEVINLARFEVGSFFGESNLLDATQCTATVTAAYKTICFFLPRMCFESFSICMPEIKYAINKALMEEVIHRYRIINNQIVKLLTEKHIAKNVISELSHRRGAPDVKTVESLPIFQEFTESELERLIKNTYLVSSDSPAYLIRQNETNPSCFYILNGAVQANIVLNNKISHFIVHPSHTLICPLSFIDKQDEIFSYNTCGRAELIEFTADYLNWVSQNDLELWYKYCDLFCRYIFSLQRKLNTKIIRLNSESI